MCKSSAYARQTRDAEKGERLIMYLGSGGLPSFRRPADNEDFLTCIKHGTCLTLAGIPPATQREHQMLSTEEVVFIEDEGDYPDCVQLDDGRIADLYTFTDDPEVEEMHVLVGEPISDQALRDLAAVLASFEEPIVPPSAPDRTLVAEPA